jgi:hypothetical protein
VLELVLYSTGARSDFSSGGNAVAIDFVWELCVWGHNFNANTDHAWFKLNVSQLSWKIALVLRILGSIRTNFSNLVRLSEVCC